MTDPQTPPRSLPPHDGRGGTGTDSPTGTLPEWARQDTDTVSLLLLRRAAGDSAAYDTWDAATTLARVLDLLSVKLDEHERLLPIAWAHVCDLSERLPAPEVITAVSPSLLDGDDLTPVATVLRDTAHALVAILATPGSGDADALLSEVAAAVARVSPLLAYWRQDPPRLTADGIAARRARAATRRVRREPPLT